MILRGPNPTSGFHRDQSNDWVPNLPFWESEGPVSPSPSWCQGGRLSSHQVDFPEMLLVRIASLGHVLRSGADFWISAPGNFAIVRTTFAGEILLD